MDTLKIKDVWYNAHHHEKPFIVTSEYDDTPEHLKGDNTDNYKGFVLAQSGTNIQIRVPKTIVANAFHRIWSRTKRGAVKNKIDALEREILQLKVTYDIER